MSIDQALNHLHAALYDDFATLSANEQSTIIITLEDLVDKLARSTELELQTETKTCPKRFHGPAKH